jgi:hypothetical protein
VIWWVSTDYKSTDYKSHYPSVIWAEQMLIYIAIAGMLIGSAASAADERKGLAEPPLCSAVLSQNGNECRLIDSRGNEWDCTTGDTNSAPYVPTMRCCMWTRGVNKDGR